MSRHHYLLVFIGLLLPFMGAAQIEDEIRRTTTIEKNPVSVVRERIVLAINAGNISLARTLTDSLNSASGNSLKKPFTLSERYVLERVMGRSDSAVKAFYDRNILAEQSSPRAYTFERNDYLVYNYTPLYQKQNADTSFVYDSTLTQETKDFIQFFRKEGRRISDSRQEEKISRAQVIRELNVNSRLFLQKYPQTPFTEYMKENMEAKCFAQMKGFNIFYDLSFWQPLGSIRSRLRPGFLLHICFQFLRPRYKLGMGVKICQSTLNKTTIHESDTVAKRKSFSMVTFALQNEFLLKSGKKSWHWLQVNSEIGHAEFILEKGTQNKKAVTLGVGPVADFSIGYHFQNLNHNNAMEGRQDKYIPFANIGFLAKAGYFTTLSNWKIQGAYMSVGITFGMLFSKRTNTPDPDQIKMYRW